MEHRRFSRPRRQRILLLMTPAKAAILNDTLAPHWEQLRAWTDKAVADHQHSRAHLTSEELVDLRRWIVVIEAILRRLVLLAATGVEVDPSITKSWSGAPKTPDEPAPDADREQTASPPDQPVAEPAPSEETPPRRKRSFRLFDCTRHPAAHDSSAPAAAARQPHYRPPRRRFRASTKPVELTPEQCMAWFESRPEVTTIERGNAAFSQGQHEPVPRKPPVTHRGPRLERKDAPDLVPTASLVERLLHVAGLVANPDALIHRAAIAMARRRELAYLASLAPAPHARGILAGCAEMHGNVIPFHHAFSRLMCTFALSYTEPDTS